MCVYSLVGDHFRETIPTRPYWPAVAPVIYPAPNTAGAAGGTFVLQPLVPSPSREEFDALKRDVEDMKKLLVRAIEYDKRTGQPDCETEEKIAFLRRVAEFVGVDLDDIK